MCGGSGQFGGARAAWSVFVEEASFALFIWIECVVGLCMRAGGGGGSVARVWEMSGCGLGGVCVLCFPFGCGFALRG